MAESDTTLPPNDDQQRAHRIALAVEREMRRRRRLLVLFMLLLLIPIGAGVFYWRSGRTDRAMVRNEVRREIAPVADVIAETRPALDRIRTAASQLQEQQSRLSVLANQQEQLARELRPVAGKLSQIERALAQGEDISRGLAQLRDGIGRQDQRIVELARTQETITGEQARLDREVRGLSDRLTRAPGADLDRRLRDNQAILEALQGEVATLKRRTGGRPSPPPN